MLGVGIWSRVEAKDYDSFLGSGGLTSAANIMIAAGVFVMIVGFFGCCGALKENKWLLTTVSIFGILLTLSFGHTGNLCDLWKVCRMRGGSLIHPNPPFQDR